MKKQTIPISQTKNIEAFQEKSALETLMSLTAEGKLNIPGVDDNVSFLQKLQTEIEKKQLAAQKDAFLKRMNNFKWELLPTFHKFEEENDKTKAELEEQRLELEAKGKMLLQTQDEIAVKQQALETKEKLILENSDIDAKLESFLLENSDIDAKLESLAALKEDLRLESLKKLEEMREFKETKDQIKSELDDRVAMVEARERELEEKEMLLAQSQVKESKKVAQETGEISPEILQSKVVQDMIVKVLMPQIKDQMVIEQQQRDERGDEDDSDEDDSIDMVNTEMQTNLVQTVDAEVQEDDELSLIKINQDNKVEESLRKYAAQVWEKEKSIIAREKSLQELKQTKPEEFYKNFNTSDQETQTSNIDQLAILKSLELHSSKEIIQQMDVLKNYEGYVQREKEEFIELAKERKLYEYHGEMVDQGVQYINEKDDPLENLKYALSGGKLLDFLDSDTIKKIEGIHNIEAIEHNLILKQTAMSFIDQSILKKVQELTYLNEVSEIKKVNLDHNTIDQNLQTDEIQIIGNDEINL